MVSPTPRTRHRARVLHEHPGLHPVELPRQEQRNAPHLRLVPDLAHDGADPPRSSALPRPPHTRVIRGLALLAFEAIEGSRTIAQLGQWLTPHVSHELAQRRALRKERDSLYRDQRRLIVTPGRAHVSRPCPTVLEASVVLHSPHRAIAVALRFEVVRSRWRATDLTVL